MYNLKSMGNETWEIKLSCAHTVINCHHSNDVVETKAQWEYFKDVYLPFHTERVYKVGDNNSQLIQINSTTIHVLEKDSDDIKCIIDFGRNVLVKRIDGKRVPSTIKTRLVTPQPKVNKPSCADIDDIIVILGLDEQDLDINMEHWVEEFGDRIINPIKPIGLTFGTDHRTACARIYTNNWVIDIQSKNLCGESDAFSNIQTSNSDSELDSNPEVNRFEELENLYGHMDTNIFEFMTEGMVNRFNDPSNSYYRDAWTGYIKKTTDDLGLFEGKTFEEMWKSKMLSDKKGLRNATCFNIHNMVSAEYHPRAEYLDIKFKLEYAKWNSSPKTLDYSREIAKYWMYFKNLLMSDSEMIKFFQMAFDEINSVTKITMEQDLINEMKYQRADIICLQEVSVVKHQKLMSSEFQDHMESYGYILSIPVITEGVKTYGAIIVKKSLM